MLIGNKDIGERVYVIAEIGGNHNGDPEAAYKLVELAAKAGADAVKFQSYKGETLVHPTVEPVPIVKKFYNTQLERFKGLELAWEVYERVFAQCAALGIDFMTTPFDLDLLERMAPHMPAIKIASGDITYPAMLRAAAATGKPVILSTGMSVMDDIGEAVALLPAERTALLHCAAVYPLPDNQANLRAITTMQARWPHLPIGYSDHTIGIEGCCAAVALGARIIEKHYTLDKAQIPGDHPLSADPADLAEMVTRIRRIEAMLGDGVKRPSTGEEIMQPKMRRGIYVKRDLPAGHVLTAEDLSVVRPVSALPPKAADTLPGRRLLRALAAHDQISPEDLA